MRVPIKFIESVGQVGGGRGVGEGLGEKVEKIEEYEKEVGREVGWLIKTKPRVLYQFGYDKDDFQQEARIAALKALRDYRDGMGAKRSTLVTKYVRQRLLNMARIGNLKKRRLRARSAGDTISLWSDVEIDLFTWDLTDTLRSRINEFQRSVLGLRMEDYSISEIAQRLTVPIFKVRWAIRAIQETYSGFAVS
jgi:DNA-directed RNA polymerase specialized sigma24 family protein